jgi:RHS repeat-associated protein
VENRVVSVSGGASFVYDGDGNRVKKTEGGQTTLYVNKYYEKNLSTGEATTNYYLGGKLIAQRKGTTLNYILQDHLGSTSVTTEANGNNPATIKYFAFGDCRNSTGTIPTDKKFTGQTLDATGLYYYGARYYDATIGRFISADTIVPDPMNPQSLNRYSYCLNNPLRYIDPNGHDALNPQTPEEYERYILMYAGNSCFGGYESGSDGSIIPKWEPGRMWPTMPDIKRNWKETAISAGEGFLLLLFIVGGPEWFGLNVGGIGKDYFFFEGHIVETEPGTYTGNSESVMNPGNKPNPLEDVVYQQRVIDQMAKGDYHDFPREYDSLAVDGQVTHGLDRGGRPETFITVRGTYKGEFGTFEWGINYKNELFHRLFRPD